MADAWVTAPGVRPVRRDYEAIVREAQQSTEHAGEASHDIGLEGTSLRHTDVQDAVGGGSSLGAAQLGSAALTAALTLYPCVFISGVGDASKEALTALLSTVGSCTVSLVLEDGEATGEASATFASAQAAEAAIRTFDGSRFDDGVLHLSVARRAAQGSLTKRGKGKGARGDRVAFSEAQRDLISDMRLQQARDEKMAFAQARAKAVSGSAASTASHAAAERTAAARLAIQEEAVAKRRKLQPKLPGALVVSTKTAPAAPPTAAPPTAAPAAAPEPEEPQAAAGRAHGPAASALAQVAAAPGSLLGLGAYESDESSDEDHEAVRSKHRV